MSATAASLEQELQRARGFVQQRQSEQAEQSYQRVLALAPDSNEALNFLGTRALSLGRNAEAIDLLERTTRGDTNVDFGLALAYLMDGRNEQAKDVFVDILTREPQFFMARLHFARALEMLGREQDALIQYFSAIMRAQLLGRWLNDATTAPMVRDLVKHGMAYAQVRRKRLFESVLEPLRQKYGADALRRTTKCLQVYLGEFPAYYPDPRQRPKFMYFPDLPSTPYFARELFPWYALLEDNVDAVREELAAVMQSDFGIEPFLKFHAQEDAAGYLGGTGKPTWDAFFFYRHGKRYEENCARCPRTAEMLESLPTLVRVRDHAPEVCFSFLTPGSHILPHRGVVNTRSVTHFPLIVPQGDLALRVGGESHMWQEGRCITFDDTYEHEAWNRTEQVRVVMLLDVWNPHLTEVEREAVAALVEVIGDFNRKAEVEVVDH